MFTFGHSHDEQVLDSCSSEVRSCEPVRVSRFGTHWLRRLGAGGCVLLLLSLFTLVSVAPALAMAAAAGQVTEFPIPQTCPVPCAPASAMVLGSDHNLWFSTQFPGGIGRITPTGQITLFADPNNGSIAGQNMRLGPDGNVWFFESTGDIHSLVERIGRITPAGQISEFLIPAFKGNRAAANQLTVGSDGNLWFTANTLAGRGTVSNGFIGRITTAGVITEFGTPTAVSDPQDIALGSDGNLWFTEGSAHAIGRIKPTGHVTEFPVAQGFPGVEPGFPGDAMVLGSDGNVWFATNNPVTIGRITPAGQVTQFADPTVGSTLAGDFTLGPDGNVWFLDIQGFNPSQVERIGRITPTGQISEFLIPTFKGNRVSVNLITVGSDGNLWFTANTFVGRGTVSNGFIGRVTTAGVITEFGTPTAVSDPIAIALGSDGNIWFTEVAARAIGRITTH